MLIGERPGAFAPGLFFESALRPVEKHGKSAFPVEKSKKNLSRCSDALASARSTY
jgi:hypothetical protein